MVWLGFTVTVPPAAETEMLVLFTLLVMNTEFVFATVTVRVTDCPAAIVCALAVMLTTVAVEGATVMGTLATVVWLPAPVAVAV
jgi:hypothetical protein